MRICENAMSSSLGGVLRALTAWIIGGLFVAHLGLGLVTNLTFLSPIIENPARTYDEKMQVKWGAYYASVRFVKEGTPEDAAILVGPGWNDTMDLYFLFPRHLFYGGEQVLQAHPEIGYIVVNGNFPDFAITGQKIMLDDQHGLIQIQSR